MYHSFIKNHSFTIIILFISVALGSALLIDSLNLQLNPRTRAHKIYVNAGYLNASPEVVELKVTTPLEAAFSRLQGITEIKSRSSYNSSEIEMNLEPNVDIEYLRFEIANKVREVYPSLPEEATYPTIRTQGIDEDRKNSPILSYSVYADDNIDNVSNYIREYLLPMMSTVEGVESIRTSGESDPEYVIYLDKERMDALSVTEADIRSAMTRINQEEGLSYARYRDEIIYVILNHNTIDDLKELIIGQGQRLIRLSDVAQVKIQPREPERIYRINGKNNVRLSFYPEEDANHLTVASRVKSKIKEQKHLLPAGYEIYEEYDATEYLKEELFKIRTRSLLSLGLLLLFVLIAYRNFRYTFMIILSLVVNLALAIICYHLLDVNLNLYALAAITISFGILIDNALVMIHHIRDHQDMKVFPSLVSATMTTIASLTVIFFLPEMWRENLAEFSRVIIINLIISLLVSLLFVPSMMHSMGGKAKPRKYDGSGRSYKLFHRLFSFIIAYRKWMIAASILAFGLPTYLLPTQMEDRPWYNKTLGSDTYKEKIKPIVDRALGGTSRLFYRYVYESASFRSNEETILYANAGLPPGSTIEQLNDLVRMVEDYVIQYHPDKVANFITNIYSGENASIRILFSDQSDFSFPFILKNRLTSMAANLGGAQWSIYGVGKGFSTASGSMPPRFRVYLKGYNLDQLNAIAETFADMLEEHPRIKEVNTEASLNWWEKDKYRFTFDVDDRRLAEYNIDLRQVHGSISGLNPRRRLVARTPEDINIRLIHNDHATNSIWNMYNEVVRSDSTGILLSDVGSISRSKVPNSIHKENQQYIKMCEWEYTGSGRFGQKYLDATLEKFVPQLPLGYEINEREYSYFMSKDKKQYGLIFLVIGLIFLICSIHFESFRAAFSIIILIPISFIGIFLTFYLWDFPFDQGGYTSFILLSGISVNAMILILSDYHRYLHQEQYNTRVEAYTRAFLGKITPIILTIFSTAIGLVPFLMFGQQEAFWFSLAVGAIGGLMFSLIAIIVVMPGFVVRLEIE